MDKDHLDSQTNVPGIKSLQKIWYALMRKLVFYVKLYLCFSNQLMPIFMFICKKKTEYDGCKV